MTVLERSCKQLRSSINLEQIETDNLFNISSVQAATLDANTGLLARQRRGASERVVLVGFATRLRGFATQFCRPQREKKYLWHPGYQAAGW